MLSGCPANLEAHTGNVLRSNMATPYVFTHTSRIIQAKIFMPSPALAISLTFKKPPENTMALGGVATGNIKAKEQATVAGSMRYHGWTQMLSPNEARMGRKMVAVAVFEVTSVKPVIRAHTMATMAQGGMT